MRMLPEPSGTFPEPPIMSAPLFSIPSIPIRNLGSAHPQARLGLGSAPDTSKSFLLAVPLTRPRIGTLGNLPYRSRTCSGVPSVTPSPTQSSNALVARGARHLRCSRTPVPSVLRTSLRAFPRSGIFWLPYSSVPWSCAADASSSSFESPPAHSFGKGQAAHQPSYRGTPLPRSRSSLPQLERTLGTIVGHPAASHTWAVPHGARPALEWHLASLALLGAVHHPRVRTPQPERWLQAYFARGSLSPCADRRRGNSLWASSRTSGPSPWLPHRTCPCGARPSPQPRRR